MYVDMNCVKVKMAFGQDQTLVGKHVDHVQDG